MRRLVIDPQTDPLWQKLIETKPSSVFHSPSWIRVLAETYNFEIQAHVLVEDPSDDAKSESRADLTPEPLAGLAYCPVSDIRGERIISLPFSDFYDPILSSPEQWFALADPLLCQGVTYKIRPLHSLVPIEDTRLQSTNKARWHGLALTPTLDELWSGLDGAVRTAVRKAQKSGVQVRIGQDETDLKAFYQMHLNVRKHKYRMVAQPYQFFQHIWKEFIQRGQGRLLLAIHQNKIIAATIFLLWQDTVYYKFNASIPEDLTVNPNELMLWSGIEYSKGTGHKLLDFGLSDWAQNGLIFYKRKFAREEKTIHFLQYSPETYRAGDLESVNVLLPQLTELLTERAIPNEITQRAGELLYRYFC